MITIFFSPTGGTKKYVEHFQMSFSNNQMINITKKHIREKSLTLPENEVVLIAYPIYGGRVPKILMEYLSQVHFQNNHFIILATYGNREFDDALIEMRNYLDDKGVIIAASACIAAHSYSEIVAKGRPNKKDIDEIEEFAKKVYQISYNKEFHSIKVPGNEPYKDPMPEPSTKPKTDYNTCIDCKKCVAVCPMEIIHYDKVSEIDGGCINCCACVKICPKNSKYFDTERILMFKEILETKFLKEKPNKIFF